MRTISRLTSVFGISAMVFGLLGDVPSASAQSQDKNTLRWVTSCNNQADEGKLVCSVSQSIFLKKTGQRIVQATIRNNNKGKVLVLALPLGLDLEHGIVLSVDENAPEKYSFKTADAKGIYANILLSEKLFDVMKSGSDLNFKFKGSAGREFSVKLTLKGLTKAIGLMDRI